MAGSAERLITSRPQPDAGVRAHARVRYIGQSWARQVEDGGAPVLDPSTIAASLGAAVRKLG